MLDLIAKELKDLLNKKSFGCKFEIQFRDYEQISYNFEAFCHYIANKETSDQSFNNKKTNEDIAYIIA